MVFGYNRRIDAITPDGSSHYRQEPYWNGMWSKHRTSVFQNKEYEQKIFIQWSRYVARCSKKRNFEVDWQVDFS